MKIDDLYDYTYIISSSSDNFYDTNFIIVNENNVGIKYQISIPRYLAISIDTCLSKLLYIYYSNIQFSTFYHRKD